jgi:peptidoglycan/xylan/chitin deacetylase (PgdA/CDA1 family)
MSRYSPILLILVILYFSPAVPAASASGAIITPANGAALAGSVAITGVAFHPEFAKWQLDLLPGGNRDQASTLAVGESRLESPGVLASLDSTSFPDGLYTLRLRVVRRDGNYDEYPVTVTIANRGGAATPYEGTYEGKQAARLGLPAVTADGAPILYLTFDDGPHPHTTPQILDILDRYNAKATFFVVGRQVKRWPETLRLAVERGHAIANHTANHKSLRGLSQEAFAAEVTGLASRIGESAGDILRPGQQVMFVRPTYGHTDANTAAYAGALGYRVVMWDIDTRDWQRPGADAIASRVLKRASPGAVVLMHDSAGRTSQVPAALETILAELGARGYVFRSLAN